MSIAAERSVRHCVSIVGHTAEDNICLTTIHCLEVMEKTSKSAATSFHHYLKSKIADKLIMIVVYFSLGALHV